MIDGKVNNLEQLCYVKKLTFTEGREKGLNILLVSNGKINFTVLLDKGMDIYNLSHKGCNISFISKNGLTNFSGDFNNQFPGGMLYTCGLDTVGGRTYPIHGKIHNIPTEIEKIEVDESGIEIVGVVHQCGLFQDNLLMRRTIKTAYNSDVIDIKTEIINEGYNDSEYCILFHMNIGYPMLDEGVKIYAPILLTKPRTNWAEKNLGQCLEMELPLEKTEEQVFFHKVDKGEIKVVNDKIKKKVTFNYDNKMLPNFIEWKSMIKGDYALGIEPSTTTLDGEFKKISIQAKNSHQYNIRLIIEDI